MPTIRRFEDIRAWQTARDLTRRVYQISNQGAFARDFGLRNQMRRAAVSVMSNVAEGFESDTQAQFIKYLGHAKASAGEVRAQLYVALDVGHISKEDFQTLFDLAEKSSRQLSAFISYLKNHPDRRQIRESAVEYEIDAGTLKRSNVQTFKPSNVPTRTWQRVKEDLARDMPELADMTPEEKREEFERLSRIAAEQMPYDSVDAFERAMRGDEYALAGH